MGRRSPRAFGARRPSGRVFGPFKRNSPQAKASARLLKKSCVPHCLRKKQSKMPTKPSAFASHAFRKICSAVKKAALSEQSIVRSLFNYHTVHEHHKSSVSPLQREFAAFRLSKFFIPSATGVWGHCAPMGFAYFCPLKVGRRKAKPCTTPRLLAKTSVCLCKK